MNKQTATSETGEQIEIEVGESPRLHEQDLPNEVFEGEKFRFEPKNFPICAGHTKEDWINQSYIDNLDGTISCMNCSWGTPLAGWYRIKDNKVIDLRSL